LADYDANMALATTGGTAPVDPRRVRNEDGALSAKVAKFRWRSIFRARTLIYSGIMLIITIGMLYMLLTRDRLEVNVLHDRNPQFVVLSDGSIRNGYTIKLLNMIPQPRTVSLSIQGLEGATMTGTALDQPGEDGTQIALDPDRLKELHVFVRQARGSSTASNQSFLFVVE